MVARRGVLLSAALVVAAVASAAGAVLWGGAAAVLVVAVAAQLALEAGKTLFLMKRFRRRDGKNGVVGTMVVEAATFVCAGGLAALLVWVTDGASRLEPAVFCVAFIAFRLSSGLLLMQRDAGGAKQKENSVKSSI